jgi:NCS1 family nucleobase:cation symporter-1
VSWGSGARAEDSRAEIVLDGVPEHERTMPLELVFWSHFSPNVSLSGWIVGIVLVQIGLDVRSAILVTLLGGIAGGIPTAMAAAMGPSTGHTQIENSRYAFGRRGVRIPALLTWAGSVGWNAVNNIPAAISLLALLAIVGAHVPAWAGLLLLAIVQGYAAHRGHHLVQAVQKVLGYVLLVTFGITGAIAIAAGGGSIMASAHPATFAALVLGFGMTVSLTLGWAPYASDYTRYIPRATPPAKVFALAFVGLFASSALTQTLGVITASRFHDTSAVGVIHDILTLTGPFGPIALAAFVISAIASNTVADTTASYSLISAGLKLPRNVSAIVTAGVALVLAMIAIAHYSTLYEDYLILLGYWTAPWLAILLVDWIACRSTPGERGGTWRRGATIFVVVALATTALFSSTAVYTGPIARWLNGADIGYFVGFFAAGLLYYVTTPARATAAVRVPAQN